jgi:hypothetical protein
VKNKRQRILKRNVFAGAIITTATSAALNTNWQCPVLPVLIGARCRACDRGQENKEEVSQQLLVGVYLVVSCVYHRLSPLSVTREN